MTQHDKAQDLVERVARAWASIDGKADLFDNDDGRDPTLGYRDGYIFEAEELLARSGLADLITAQAERIKALEGRLSGLHEAHAKTVDTANEQFHRANRHGSVLQWIAEHGDGEARQRARAALAQGQKEGE